MSVSESKSFGAQVLARLEAMDDEEFVRLLRERCPELFEGRGPMPKDAVVPNAGAEEEAEEAVSTAAANLKELATTAAEVTEALGAFKASLKDTRRASSKKAAKRKASKTKKAARRKKARGATQSKKAAKKATRRAS